MSASRTCLYARHLAAGAKIADFGGWDMPIEYAGVVAEHTRVREDVGMFDVSHMGKVRISGSGALAAVNAVLTNDLERIVDGQAQYSMLCNDAGGVVDDLIVYRVSVDEVRIIPNAANAPAVVTALRSYLPGHLVLEDLQLQQGIIAIQGPESERAMQVLGLPSDLAYMHFRLAEFEAEPVMICRTGYTGERGFEIVAGNDTIVSVWDQLVAAGIAPIGLGARDTLRTEMGYALHGHELSLDITPVAARLGWAVGWDKPAFVGREALLALRAAGAPRVLRGLRALDRGIPRDHMQVFGDEIGGTVVGETSSGTFSPTLKVGIALAFLDAALTEGAQVVVDVRGRPLLCEVTRPPFVTATSLTRD